MKVIGINGSPRKNKNSAAMLEHALAGAASVGAETERIDLIDLQFSGCISCFACKRIGGSSFGRCAVKDDLKAVLDKILSADAVIFSNPVYFGDVPGMMRNLFERLWFPALMYRKDGALAYDKRIRVGMLYTMNVPDESFYRQLTENYKQIFGNFLGETKVLCATDTLQFHDYSLYVGDMFDEAHKKARHETVFPQDCARAFALGAELGSSL